MKLYTQHWICHKGTPSPTEGHYHYHEASLANLRTALAKYGRVDVPLEPDALMKSAGYSAANDKFPTEISVYKAMVKAAQGGQESVWSECPCGGGYEECPDPKTGKPLCDEKVLDVTTEEANTIRQLFNSVYDTNHVFLKESDYLLAKRIYEFLGMNVPRGVEEGGSHV